MLDHTRAALADGTFVAYTAGSCKGNPGPGGAAYRLYTPNGELTDKSRKSPSTTNIAAEMWAVIDVLEVTLEGVSVLICLSSEIVKDGFEKYLPGWQARGWTKTNGEDVANRELWELIVNLSETRQVSFHKVKARAGDPDNARVVSLARKQAEKADRVRTVLRGMQND